MARARPQQRNSRQHDRGDAAHAVLRIKGLLLPSAMALIVATHLIPSEAVAPQGTHAVLCMAWCVLLAVWGTVTAFSPGAQIVFSLSDAALLALIGLHTLSGVLPHDGVVTRSAWNVVWVWISYGICYLLLRQLLTSTLQARAVTAVMMGLAVCLTAHAGYQYFVGMPRVRAEFHANPEKILKEEGIPLEADSPARQHFVDRLEAREPLATFALTNSLAGFLAPWTVFAAGLALILWQTDRRKAAATIVVAIAVAGCLLLTKSRTGVLAALTGSLLLALLGRTSLWRIDWRLPAAAAGVLMVLGLAVVAVGGLDAKVLSEAPKSLLYRIEYWQATGAMIEDYPVLGCGPGNFQDYYTRYKLPQSSETIADPHNVLLEVCATAGTPALVALLVWMGLLAVEMGGLRPEGAAQPPDAAESSERELGGVFIGALCGIAIGFGLAFLTVFPLWTEASGGHIGIVLVGLPLACVWAWHLRSWIVSGSWPAWLPTVALVTLLVNLMAAGAASFPGVVSSGLLLAACALSAAGGNVRRWLAPRFCLPALIVGPLGLGLACFWTEYSPVLRRQGLMHEGDQLLADARRRPVLTDEAIRRYYAAAEADAASSEPWERLAGIHLQMWLATGSGDSWDRFVAAAEEWERLRPASYRQHAERGAWYLQAYRQAHGPEQLEQARRAYEAAVRRYPASAVAHAQLALMHQIRGDSEQAEAEVARARQLDALNPHAELKLGKSHLVDPVPDSGQPGGWRITRPETAEQTLSNLRSAEVLPVP